MTITNDGMVLYVAHNHLGLVKINGLDLESMTYRAKQICALPKMVELLKEMSEQSLFFENENGEYEGTEYHHDATAILREIGELE